MRTGENIYKRKDGRWEARYRKGRNSSGALIYGSCYGKTYSEAKAKMEQARQCLIGVPPPVLPRGSIPPFGEVCDEWLRCNQLRLKQSTCVKYRSMIDKYIRPALGSCALSDISTAKISRFGADLLNTHGLAPKTAKDILVLLHALLEYSSRQYPGGLGPVEVQYPKKQPREMRVLSRAEQKILTDYLMEDLCPRKFGILLALWTGMRIGEICALQWKHISIEEQSIWVDTTMLRLHSSDPGSEAKTIFSKSIIVKHA